MKYEEAMTAGRHAIEAYLQSSDLRMDQELMGKILDAIEYKQMAYLLEWLDHFMTKFDPETSK